ncbi:MAG: M20 family peptidase, partial [Psychromonas sp.]|nr:M20 family peptidase [Psychromonas sp.]
MNYFNELKCIVELNSHTANKRGVDQNGAVFRTWMEQLGYDCTVFSRDLIGDHLLFESGYSQDYPRVLLLGHLDTVFPSGTFEGYREDNEWIYGPGV